MFRSSKPVLIPWKPWKAGHLGMGRADRFYMKEKTSEAG